MLGFDYAKTMRPTRIARSFRAFGKVLAFLPFMASCTSTLAPPVKNIPPEVVQPAQEETLAAQAYFLKVEANYTAQGLLRTDGGGRDTPFDRTALVENFLRIAFFDEFSDRGGALVSGGRQQVLHRWEEPIRMQLEFGPTVPPSQSSTDRAFVTNYLTQLSDLTGLPIQLVDKDPNYLVMVLGPGERRESKDRIQEFAPGTSRAALVSALNMANDTYCTVFSYSEGKSPIYSRSLAVIRSELPTSLRRSCFHEEIAQGLGLVNDSPKARPSIFNDDQEFALLTTQDALMLRILYDKRLRPGMTLEMARPIVESIVEGLLPDQS